MIRFATAATTTGFTISKLACSCISPVYYWTMVNGAEI